MRWIKQGLIYCAGGTQGWAQSHAALPTPYRLSDSVLRIYCAFRGTEKNVSRIGYVDVSADNPKDIIGVSAQPVLDIGCPGAFDDNGVVPVSVVSCGDLLYLYYGGFELGVKVPYTLFSGLAVSSDGGDGFTRRRQTPILERSDGELFFRTAPHVIRDGEIWKMWYIAGSGWIEHGGKLLPRYSVHYLESPDGVQWGDEGQPCLFLQGDEHGFGRPYVVKDAQGYRMYYSIRSLSKGYRLGYAQSSDGKTWVRQDEDMGLDVSARGWDSQSVCYSAVIGHKDRLYCFYNGNHFGETGFGYAEMAL